MKIKPILLISALAVPAVLALSAPRDKVAFQAKAGQAVVRSFEAKHELALEDMDVTMNGQPSPMPMEMEMSMDLASEQTIRDAYVAVAEGRPGKLRRTFEKLHQGMSLDIEAAQMPDGGMNKSFEAKSELEGKTVVFEWNEGDGGFKTTFEEGGGDEKLLEGLVEDMDLRGLLPEKEVSEGDTWEVEPAQLKPVFQPGGDLKLVPEVDPEDAMGMPGGDMSQYAAMFDGDIEGEVKAEYKGSRDVEGVRVGVIHLVLDIKVKTDATEQAAKQLEKMPEGTPPMEFDHIDVEVGIEAEGDLYWDLAAGIPHSFELTGTMTVGNDMGMTMKMGENSMEIGMVMTLAGSFSQKMSVAKQ